MCRCMTIVDVCVCLFFFVFYFFFSSRRRHTRCALVTGVQTCALPIFRLGLDDNNFIRFAYSRAMARPDFGLLRNVVAVQTPSLDASADSPNIVRDGAGNISGYKFTFRAERGRSEEHTSELQSLMRNSYAVFCLKKNKKIEKLHTKTSTRNE